MSHTRGFPAIIATLVLAFAFAACGSDDRLGRLRRIRRDDERGRRAGVAKAAAAPQAVRGDADGDQR